MKIMVCLYMDTAAYIKCEIEWFHLECVGLRAPPKGHWYCRNCAEELKVKQRKL